MMVQGGYTSKVFEGDDFLDAFDYIIVYSPPY